MGNKIILLFTMYLLRPLSLGSFLLLFIYFSLEDNYNTVLVSAIQQHESATGINMPPPS